MKDEKKWRRRYKYRCSVCTVLRYTLSYRRLQMGICTLCEAEKEEAALIARNTSLFEDIEPQSSQDIHSV